jgi:putative transposase
LIRDPALLCVSRYVNDIKEVITTAYKTGDYTMEAIADEFGVHYAAVSHIVKKAKM